ncbi:MAG: alanine dehydrogenase [Calditrichaeota bacterium]|nr:alanine dehydrogenase [Calditrichota bacterium]
MNFGVLVETRPFEYRVGLTPAAVDSLVRAGHQVFIEQNAGLRAGFPDERYHEVHAQVVYTALEVYKRSDVIVKVARPTEEEYPNFRSGQIICSFLNLAVASRDLLEELEKSEITTIAYESIRKENGQHPVVTTTSEVAGRMAPIVAGELLKSFRGGRGILMSGLPGVPPAAVVIIGAGTLGRNAARCLHNLGAQVTVLDKNLDALQGIDEMFGGKVGTMYANSINIGKAVAFSDVLITSAAEPGGRADILVTREMLKDMRPRSVILDLAIDCGGNVETSRPTNLANPTFVEEEIIHYCVPNVSAQVSRTASYALSNSMLPYLRAIGDAGLEVAIQNHPELKSGINTLHGKLVNEEVARLIQNNGD